MEQTSHQPTAQPEVTAGIGLTVANPSPETVMRLEHSHYRASGQPKVEFHNRTEAAIAAARRTSQLGTLFEEYKCRAGSHWHIGNDRTGLKREKPRVFEAAHFELDPRVIWNMWHENYESRGKKLGAIASRTRRLGREAIPSRKTTLN